MPLPALTASACEGLFWGSLRAVWRRLTGSGAFACEPFGATPKRSPASIHGPLKLLITRPTMRPSLKITGSSGSSSPLGGPVGLQAIAHQGSPVALANALFG